MGQEEELAKLSYLVKEVVKFHENGIKAIAMASMSLLAFIASYLYNKPIYGFAPASIAIPLAFLLLFLVIVRKLSSKGLI